MLIVRDDPLQPQDATQDLVSRGLVDAALLVHPRVDPGHITGRRHQKPGAVSPRRITNLYPGVVEGREPPLRLHLWPISQGAGRIQARWGVQDGETVAHIETVRDEILLHRCIWGIGDADEIDVVDHLQGTNAGLEFISTDSPTLSSRPFVKGVAGAMAGRSFGGGRSSAWEAASPSQGSI